MSALRIVLHDADGKRTLAWQGGTWVVGRDAGCDVAVAAVDVSRRHARITFGAISGRVRVEDLGSANGCYIGETRITSGDYRLPFTLRLGTACSLTFCFDDAAGAAGKRLFSARLRLAAWGVAIVALLAWTWRDARTRTPPALTSAPPTLLSPPALPPQQLLAWSHARLRDASFLPGASGLAAAGFAQAARAISDSSQAAVAAAWAATAAAARDRRLHELEYAAVRAWRRRDQRAAALAAGRWLDEARTVDAATAQRAAAMMQQMLQGDTP